MITDELLRANGMTREEYERDLQQLREWAEQFRVHMKEKLGREFFEPEMKIKQEFCERNEELDSLFKEVSD